MRDQGQTRQDGGSRITAGIGDEAGARNLIAVFVLEVRANERVNLPKALTAAIARELLDHGDAYGWPEV